MKLVFIFLSVFLFTQVCEIYIMGGFYHQTIWSKVAAVFFGIVLGIAVTALKYELDKRK